MTGEQARQAAEVLRQRAPACSHEIRHACHAAIKTLEDYAAELDAFTATRERLLALSQPPLGLDTLGPTDSPC
jgi:hypothetical protein